MKEIEILVQIHEPHESVAQKLSSLQFVGEKKVIDRYFYDPLRDNLKPGKEFEITECFRVRTKDGKHYLTYKIDRFDRDNVWLYSDENETIVDDLEEVLAIVDRLGLQKLIEINNTKYTYLSDTYEVVLEDVENLGSFLEIELLHPADGVDVYGEREKMREVLSSFGFEFTEIEVGKPELMLRKFGIVGDDEG